MTSQALDPVHVMLSAVYSIKSKGGPKKSDKLDNIEDYLRSMNIPLNKDVIRNANPPTKGKPVPQIEKSSRRLVHEIGTATWSDLNEM